MAAYQFEPANLVSRVRKFHRIRLCHKREHGSRTEFPRNRSSMLHHPSPEFSVLDTTGKSFPPKMILWEQSLNRITAHNPQAEDLRKFL